jgi:cell fate (sporulation/competence/biofilm development) regulator YmcA (YheA/YmcA/DUF963 family)
MAKISLQAQAEELIRQAQEKGVKNNYFFVTTFKRYQVQLSMLERLEAVIKSEPSIVEKEYVKGRKNIVTHPAITEYNKTSTAANQTASTLLKIITTFAEEQYEDGMAADEL